MEKSFSLWNERFHREQRGKSLDSRPRTRRTIGSSSRATAHHAQFRWGNVIYGPSYPIPAANSGRRSRNRPYHGGEPMEYHVRCYKRSLDLGSAQNEAASGETQLGTYVLPLYRYATLSVAVSSGISGLRLSIARVTPRIDLQLLCQNEIQEFLCRSPRKESRINGKRQG